MITYPNTTQQISKKTTTTTKTYDEEGRLVTEETYEEIEYVSAPAVLPQPGITPNTPWIVSNAVNTSGVAYHEFLEDHHTLDESEPGVQKTWVNPKYRAP